MLIEVPDKLSPMAGPKTPLGLMLTSSGGLSTSLSLIKSQAACSAKVLLLA